MNLLLKTYQKLILLIHCVVSITVFQSKSYHFDHETFEFFKVPRINLSKSYLLKHILAYKDHGLEAHDRISINVNKPLFFT